MSIIYMYQDKVLIKSVDKVWYLYVKLVGYTGHKFVICRINFDWDHRQDLDTGTC